ncbi:hypothetical protein BC567DRAFT_239513 [Phyllosticta citribraziliensis]
MSSLSFHRSSFCCAQVRPKGVLRPAEAKSTSLRAGRRQNKKKFHHRELNPGLAGTFVMKAANPSH